MQLLCRRGIKLIPLNEKIVYHIAYRFFTISIVSCGIFVSFFSWHMLGKEISSQFDGGSWREICTQLLKVEASSIVCKKAT